MDAAQQAQDRPVALSQLLGLRGGAQAAERILWAKTFNAGQICTTVDYMFLPEGSEQEFTREATRVIAQRYPNLNHADYTAIIDERSHPR